MGTRPWRGFCAIRAGARIAPETRLTPDLHRTELNVQEQADHIAGSCPAAWCRSGIPGQRWLPGQAARGGRLTGAVSLSGAMVSRLM